MRFFIALVIPESSKQELSQVQRRLSQIIPELKPTDPDKLHLTIAFVGEQPEELKEPLIEVLNKCVEGIKPFTITPAYIDGFPSLHTAHIIWSGVKGDIDKLFIVRERIKDGILTLQLDTDERRFVPHIALGKLTNFHLSAAQEIEIEKLEQQSFKPITVSSIKLFESQPDHGLHSHNTLAEIKLI